MKKVYIAGPDVFFPDIERIAARQKARCGDQSWLALHPVDQPELSAEVIYRNNIALLREADGVLANFDPFRGAEVDSGTAFEVGYAVACGKPVVGYVSNAASLLERVAACWGPVTRDPRRTTWHDRDGCLIENFGYRVNLMIGVSCPVVVGDFEAAICTLKGLFES